MPLLAPTVPLGFEPLPNLVVPEVFEQMKKYMNYGDPEERRIREFKMKKTLDELSNDPAAQMSCLRLEAAPTITKELNKDKGKVFDFNTTENEFGTATMEERTTFEGTEGPENDDLVKETSLTHQDMVPTEERLRDQTDAKKIRIEKTTSYGNHSQNKEGSGSFYPHIVTVGFKLAAWKPHRQPQV